MGPRRYAASRSGGRKLHGSQRRYPIGGGPGLLVVDKNGSEDQGAPARRFAPKIQARQGRKNLTQFGHPLKSHCRASLRSDICPNTSDDCPNIFGMGVRIHRNPQLIADLRQGTVQHLSLSSFRRNDQAAAPDILEILGPGDLILRDLGYWALHVFEAILLKGAFFLSRYRHDTRVLDPRTGKPLNLAHLLRTQGSLDRQVWLGDKHRLSFRLVAVPVPDALANERRRRAQANRDKRLNPSPQHLFLLGWNIFVTNVDRNTWPPKAIQPIYRLRWRIEMIFKAWKSHLGLRELNCRTADLLRLSLMTKLLFCVLVCQVCNQLELLQTEGRHVSLLRLARVIAECSCLVAAAILGLPPQQWLAHQLTAHAFYEQRTDRKNFYEMLAELTRA